MIKKQIDIEVPKNIMENWQETANLLSDIVAIPAALIMRYRDPEIEVFVSSKSEGNPYKPGDKEKLMGSGLYCETVIKSQKKLLVPNALEDPEWKDNPDIKLNMISYLGFPILLPNKEPFGTICILDSKRNEYSKTVENLIAKLRNMIEFELEMIYINKTLGEENNSLSDYLAELQALRGIVPICSNCKSIRTKEEKWQPIEQYLIKNPVADFSHSLCPECMQKLYPEFDDES
ncbi:MAG: GAF domain-containing protein [Bacteroidales bacterium]|nr:GAF domain-containing protein [Bacteroidales bacterium]